MNSGKIVLGILTGIATGAALGILFAPDKGTTTRKKIYQKGGDYVEGIEDKFTELMDVLQQKFEKIRIEADVIVDDARSKAEAFAAKMNANATEQKAKSQS